MLSAFTTLLYACLLYTSVVQFTETLPFAQVTDQYLSFPRLLFLLLFLYLFAWYLVSRRSRPLLVALTSLLLFFVIGSHERLTGGPTRLVVFNTPSTSEIAIFAEKRRHYVELPRNGLLPHPTKGILRLSDGEIERLHAEEPFPLHTLILSEYRYFNVNRLLNLFQPEVIVLDSSDVYKRQAYPHLGRLDLLLGFQPL